MSMGALQLSQNLIIFYPNLLMRGCILQRSNGYRGLLLYYPTSANNVLYI